MRWTPLVWGALACLLLITPPAYAQQAQHAGAIAAIKPQGSLVRGKKAAEAHKGDDVFWKDIIRTQPGGRIRLGLDDGSVLNIGSEAQVQIVEHDAQTQQSDVVLGFGKMRAVVKQLTGAKSKFEVHTNTTVLGVIGTDFYMDARPASTYVLCLQGIVTVRSSNPNVPGVVTLYPGEATTVNAGQPPQPKHQATPEEIGQALEATQVAPSVTVNPTSAVQGSVFEASITGEHLLPVGALHVSGTGVTIAVLPNATETQIPVRVTVASDAPLGSHPFTLQAPQGELSGEVVVTPLPGFELHLSPGLTAVSPLTVAPGGTSAVEQVLVSSLSGFSGPVALSLSGVPDGVTPTLSASSVDAGGSAQLTFAAGPNAVAGDYTLTLNGASATRKATARVFLHVGAVAAPEIHVGIEHVFNPSEPPAEITGSDIEVDQGSLVRLDASGTTVAGGRVASFRWEVTDSPLRGADPRFEVNTWNVNPGAHRILLDVTSSTGATSHAEFRLTVLPPPNPDEVLQGLRQAYETLQVNQYLSYFDPVRFRAYPGLEESVRDSFNELSEARVYLRIDNSSRQGDDAVYQATFEVTFRTKEQPEVEQSRTESLTLRLLLERTRTHAAWKIVDYGVTVSSDPNAILGGGVLPPGTTAGAEPVLTLTVSPASINFGNVAVGSFSSVQIVTLENVGSGDVTLNSITLGNTGGPFSLGLPTSLPATLAPGGHFDFDVDFGPVSPGPASDAITIASTAPNSPTVIVVSGFGAEPAISVTPSSLDFGNVLVGETSPTQTFTIQNTGTGDLVVSSVSFSGSSDFVVTSAATPPVTITPGSSVDVQVAFAPSAVGAASTTGTIVSNAPTSPTTVDVTGNGVIPAAAVQLIKTAGTAADGDTLFVVQPASVTYNYQVTNTGNTELINIQVLDSLLGSVGTIASLLPNQSQTLTMTTTVDGLSAGDRLVNIGIVTATPGFGGISLGLPDVQATDDAVVAIQSPVQVGVFNGNTPSSTTGNSYVTPLTIDLSTFSAADATVAIVSTDPAPFTANISFSDLAPDVSANPSTASVNVASQGTANFTFSAVSSAPRGIFQGTVIVDLSASGQGILTVPVFFNIVDGSAPSFTLTQSTTANTPVTLFPQSGGGNVLVGAPFGVTISPQNNFSGQVTVSFSGLPAGIAVNPATAVFDFPAPGTLAGSGLSVPQYQTATFTASADLSLAPGDYTATVTATDGTVTQTDTVFLQVPPYVTIQTPFDTGGNPLVIPQGGSAILPVTITPVGGFSGTVSLSLSMASFLTGVTVDTTTQSVTVSGAPVTANFVFSADASATPGARTAVQILQGVSGAGSLNFAQVDVVVGADVNPWFTVASSPPASPAESIGVAVGDTVGIDLTFTSFNGFSGQVNWTATPEDTQLASVSPASGSVTVAGTAPATQSLQVTIPASAPCPTAIGPVAFVDLSATGVDAGTSTSTTVTSQLVLRIFCANSTATFIPGESALDPLVLTQGGQGQQLFFMSWTWLGSPTTMPSLVFSNLPSGVFANVPEQDPVFAGSFAGNAGSALEIAVFFTTAPDTPVGNYQATLSVTGNGVSYNSPFFIEVQPGIGSSFSVVSGAPASGDVVVQPCSPSGPQTRAGPARDVAGDRDGATRRSGPRRQGPNADLPRQRSGGAALSSGGTGAAGCVRDGQVQLAVRAEEIRTDPRVVRPGEMVSFRVPVHNLGTAPANGVVVEFSVPELNLRHRETINLEAGETATVVFEMEFSAAELRRTLRPQVTLDPDRTLVEASRHDNTARLAPLGTSAAAGLGGPAAGRRQRVSLTVTAGDCVGFRFSGFQTECGRGADVEFTVSPDGLTIRAQAAALQVLPQTSLEQVQRMPSVSGGTQMPVERNQLVAARSSLGRVAVFRLVNVRRSPVVRERTAQGPREVQRPGGRRYPAAPERIPGMGADTGALPLVRLTLEWVGGQ